ncbi:MAG: YlxR family protein [Abditibacteriota bacterium]|nr:YlxR family protein [Abditibacteriota bacterium]
MRERSCIVCKAKGPQDSFFRIGKNEKGELFAGKGGRGAYLCRSRACLEKAYAKPRLAYCLKAGRQDAENERRLLSSLMEALPGGKESR